MRTMQHRDVEGVFEGRRGTREPTPTAKVEAAGRVGGRASKGKWAAG